MNDFNPSFDNYLRLVYQAYEDLLEAPLCPVTESSPIPVKGGVYVFYEGGKPIYVGRTRNLRRRLGQHHRLNSSHYSASFAFLLAREKAALPKEPKMTRAETAKQLDSLFSLCRQRVSCMQVRWVHAEDSIVQSLLEVYAALALRTTDRYNSFRTT